MQKLIDRGLMYPDEPEFFQNYGPLQTVGESYDTIPKNHANRGRKPWNADKKGYTQRRTLHVEGEGRGKGRTRK